MVEEMENQPKGTMDERTIELIQRQEKIGLDIEQLIRNVKKDPKDRKTRTYYAQRAERLRELMHLFQVNHDIISEEDNVPADHNYIKKDYFNNIKKLADTWLGEFDVEGKKAAILEGAVSKSAFEAPLAAARESVRTPTLTDRHSSSGAHNIDVLFKSHQALMNSLIDIKEKLLKEGFDTRKKSYYQGKARLIVERLEKMEIINNQISSSSQPNINGYSAQKFLKFQEEMQEVVDEIQDVYAQDKQTLSTSSELDKQAVPLPKIHIPKFDGTYSQWIQFKELFIELIHKRQIHEVQKMYYLSSFMTGEAKNLIKHLPMSPENYAVAWDIVTNRYDNKRLLVTELMNKLLSQPSTSSESSSTFKELHDITVECMLGLKAQGLPVDQWDLLIAHIIMKKLDRTTHANFEQSLTDNKNPVELDTILQFLEHRFQSLEALGKGTKSSPKTSASAVKKESKCKICHNGEHQLYACSKFKNDTIASKWQHVKQLKLCCNCLKPGHKATDCKYGHCKFCEKKHNSMLHSKASTQTEAENVNQAASSSTTSLLSGDVNNKYVLLGTARIIVTANNGQQVECRAILDSGSQINVVTKSLVKKLNAQTNSSNLNIEGIGKTSKNTNHRVNLKIQSRVNKFTAAVDAHVLQEIISKQPSLEIETSEWNLPNNIELADPDFNKPDRIDMLLGAEFYHQLIWKGKITINRNLPIMQNTAFGWVVAGKIQQPEGSRAVCAVCSDDNLEEAFSRFWQVEEVTEPSKIMTVGENLCEEHFVNNTTKTNSGRFIVKLPFAGDIELLGESKGMAYNRFIALERRLSKNPELKKQYTQFMDEYENLGHMTEIPQQSIKKPHYFIPHHCVVRPDSTSTKLRVVFDASAKTTTGVSLNELMHTGKTVQSELFSILLRFRMPRFVFKTDIEKMYRQIYVHPDDRMLQLIMWRSDITLPIKYFQLNTVTYGTRAAPFLATRCLEKIAQDSMNTFPAGSAALKENFYVDDGLAGANSIADAIEIKNQLTSILKMAGMNPRKWSANCPHLMQGIASEDQEINLDFNNESNESVKTLGLQWLPTADELRIKVSINNEAIITKRQVASELARIFDPLGLIAPVVVTAKIFIQQLWDQQLDWDSPIPSELHAKWLNFRNNLQALNNIKIPRHIFNHQEKISTQLHVFCDASEKAYGACIYIRSIKKDKTIMSRLLCSKSRVAPLKRLTIPRLELCAAVLATELASRVKKDLSIQNVVTYYWTDSQIVLSWINQKSAAFQAFVGHRIQKIQNLALPQQWRHVASKQNPADILSRGINPCELATTHIWFVGPMFLYQSEGSWKSPVDGSTIDTNSLELKRKVTSIPISYTSSVPLIQTIEAKNNFRTLQRTLGYVFRFIKNCKLSKTARPETSALTPAELNSSLRHIIKEIQQGEFKEVIKLLQDGKPLPNSHSLSSLSPFLDEEGILRVGGRLEHSSQAYDAKHQMLLPFNDPIAKLLMEAVHRENRHCSPQALLAELRQQFWPIKGKDTARSIVNHCIRCRRAKPVLYKQIMGHLPADRVQPARPFLVSGVDYCGPFKIHFSVRGKHPQKTYVAIFVCFVTKAVHLELVSNLSTEAFIGALKRFTALRGHCKTLYSDNGTNFVGARNLIEDAILSSSAQEKIIKVCSQKGIEFRFIPPRSPHFGGLWEAAVKSAKHLLLRSTEAATLTDEQLRTALAEIGAILNSRPLTPMSNDPNDLNALTPGHFLIGESLTSTVSDDAHTSSNTLQQHWKRLAQIKREFWNRWSKEYLSSLQLKHKWKGPITNVKEGTMVILKEDNLPVLQWPLGRIIQVYKGQDEVVRVVDVKTERGVFKRAVHRLAPLFPEDHKDSPNNSTNSNEGEQHETQQVEPSPNSTTSLLISIPLNRIKNPSILNTDTIPKKRSRLSTNFAVTIITLLLLPLALCNPITITQLPNKPGIHFEKVGQVKLAITNWKIIVYFDLEPFNKDITLLKEGLSELIKTCTANESPPCSLMIKHFHKIEEDLESGFEIFSRRKRRGALDIIGNVANSLFGVLDANYEQQMSKTITHIQGNEEHLINLLKNQTSLVDSTINVIKQDQANVKLKFDEIDAQLNAINNQLGKSATSTQATLALCVQLLALSSSLLQTRSSLLDVLIDSHHGKVNPNVLTPHQLSEELGKIRMHLPPQLQLPGMMENILQFYKLMEVDGIVAENHIIFTINLPLLDQRAFHLYFLTPINVIIDDSLTSVKVSTAWLAINDHRDEHFTMTEKIIESCSHTNRNIFLCPNVQSTRHKYADASKCELHLFNGEAEPSCELQTSNQDTLWYQLYDKNKWIFSIKHSLRMTSVCNGQNDVVSLNGTGILELQADCTLKSEEITIHGHDLASTTLEGGYTSLGLLSLNFSKNTPRMPPLHPYESKIDELTAIQENLVRHQVFTLSTQSSITHSLGIAYGALGLALCILAIVVINCYRKRQKKTQHLVAPQKPHRSRSSFDISTI